METTAEGVAVKRGDTLDLVTDCYKTVDHDSFAWNVKLKFSPTSGKSSTNPPQVWDTKKDFGPSAHVQHKPLTDWEKYAQVLLLANELVFVD